MIFKDIATLGWCVARLIQVHSSESHSRGAFHHHCVLAVCVCPGRCFAMDDWTSCPTTTDRRPLGRRIQWQPDRASCLGAASARTRTRHLDFLATAQSQPLCQRTRHSASLLRWSDQHSTCYSIYNLQFPNCQSWSFLTVPGQFYSKGLGLWLSGCNQTLYIQRKAYFLFVINLITRKEEKYRKGKIYVLRKPEVCSMGWYDTQLRRTGNRQACECLNRSRLFRSRCKGCVASRLLTGMSRRFKPCSYNTKNMGSSGF